MTRLRFVRSSLFFVRNHCAAFSLLKAWRLTKLNKTLRKRENGSALIFTLCWFFKLVQVLFMDDNDRVSP